MEEKIGLMIAFAAILGIFVVIPLVIFLIVRKILSDRHRERMAMIEKGMAHTYRRADSCAQEQQEPSPQTSDCPDNESMKTPSVDYYRRDKAEDSTIKWMYIFGGAAIGLLIASLVTNLLFTYTLIETKGLGLSIVVLSICVALYIYYVRKNRRGGSRGGRDLAERNTADYTED